MEIPPLNFAWAILQESSIEGAADPTHISLAHLFTANQTTLRATVTFQR